MRQMRTIIALALVAAFGFSLVGCGAPKLKEEEIIGKWVAIKKTTVGGGREIGFVIEFFQDKTVSLPSGKGAWSIAKDGRLQVDMGNTTMYGTLEDNQLTINYPDYRGAVIFKRK